VPRDNSDDVRWYPLSTLLAYTHKHFSCSDLATGRVALDEAILHGVIHMLLLDVVERSASPSRAGFECLYNLFRGVHSNYNTAFARVSALRIAGIAALDLQCRCSEA
jgi:hypothetical protein